MDLVDGPSLSYEDFCKHYMAKNKPVRIASVNEKWFTSTRAWVTESQSNTGVGINYPLLRKLYGHHNVPVVDGDPTDYGSQIRTTMRFDAYLDMLEGKIADKKYLKDWHLVHQERENGPFYRTPVFFQDDWLNWWWDRKEASGDDYRFVYIGPAGSWTPLHQDVFRSFSWSVNITGRKEWIFFHPDDESKLKDRFGRTVLPDFRQIHDEHGYDREMYPYVHEATPIYVTQGPGEAIFVPSGWYHQVHNVEDTISINHNWFNGFNLCTIWTFLQQENRAVELELEHLKEIGLINDEFRNQCQVVLRANTGMDYLEFQEMLRQKKEEMQTRLKRFEILSNWEHETLQDHLSKVDSILVELEKLLFQ